MNTAPLLPETRFKPLSEAKLDTMINNAVAARQLPRQAEVIAFRRPWAFGTGMAAMAASIMLAFMVTPQYSSTMATGSQTAQLEDTTVTADVGDMLLLDSLGA